MRRSPRFVRRVTRPLRRAIAYGTGLPVITRGHGEQLSGRQKAVRRAVRIGFWSTVASAFIFGVPLGAIPSIFIIIRHKPISMVTVHSDKA